MPRLNRTFYSISRSFPANTRENTAGKFPRMSLICSTGDENGNPAYSNFQQLFTLLLKICVRVCLCILCRVFYCDVSGRSVLLLLINRLIDYPGRVSRRYQKGKTKLDFTEARDSEWQWHQLGHMQVYTSLHTDNHVSTPPLSFYQIFRS